MTPRNGLRKPGLIFFAAMVMLFAACQLNPPAQRHDAAIVDVSAENAKIEALIKSVEDLKDAQFVRNGIAYNAEIAGEFMRGKWNTNKEKVNTAADFVRICATASTTTGQAYLIRFANGTEVKSGEFLTAQLEMLNQK